jgi:2-oxoglutarate ferredoxin oxidoreductase subunit gamma
VSFHRFKDAIRSGSVIVIDPHLVCPTADDRKIWKFAEIPIVEIAKNEVGNLLTQSTLALAITVRMTGCVEPELALSAMLSKISPKYAEVNKKAFALGLKYAEEAIAKLEEKK